MSSLETSQCEFSNISAWTGTKCNNQNVGSRQRRRVPIARELHETYPHRCRCCFISTALKAARRGSLLSSIRSAHVIHYVSGSVDRIADLHLDSFEAAGDMLAHGSDELLAWVGQVDAAGVASARAVENRHECGHGHKYVHRHAHRHGCPHGKSMPPA